MAILTMALSSLQRECEAQRVTLQYVMAGKKPLALDADVLAVQRDSGTCEVQGLTLVGELFLSLLTQPEPPRRRKSAA